MATVRALDTKDLKEINAEVILANTYHLHLRPGEKTINKLGKLHKFMNWNKPIITDSGGFQAFSLGFGMEHNINKLGNIFPKSKKSEQKEKKWAKIDNFGVEFNSHIDGKKIKLTPENSIKIQEDLGADIILAFDECTSPLSDYDYTKKALKRTHSWALECIEAHKTKQALFGIVQGGAYKDLRQESAKFINSLGFQGHAIGGSLGKSKKDMLKILEWTVPLLNKEKPRHLLGIGAIDDLFNCIERGIDIFDCAMPTRIARRGNLYSSEKKLKDNFRINIQTSRFKTDNKPIDRNCNCYVCKNFSRAYLRHLYMSNELLYFRLASLHNLNFILELMEKIRTAINENSFKKLKKQWLK